MNNHWIKTTKEDSNVIDLTIDAGVEDAISNEIVNFCSWLKSQYIFNQSLEIELVNNYYLIHEGKRVGYLFIYGDEETPLLVLPVKGYPEKWSLEAILFSLLQGIDDYMALQANKLAMDHYDEAFLESILQTYLKQRG